MKRACLVLAPLLAIALLASGCKPDRAAALRKEIKQLQEDRVPNAAVEKAKKDADAAEAAAAQRQQELEAAKAKLAKLVAEGGKTADAFNRQVDTNAHLRQEIDDTNQKIVAARKKHQALSEQIGQEKERAGYLRDQAVTLGQQIRPGDPAWANARRVENLSQLLRDAAKAYPHDPVLARLARADLGTAQQPAVDQAVTTARALQERLRWVYGLDAASVATGPPAAGGGQAPPGSPPGR